MTFDQSIRTPQGRFAKGNPGGPGNPNAKRVAAFRQALLATVTEEDIAEIARTLLAQAKLGDLGATKLLFGYVLGAPATFEIPDDDDAPEANVNPFSLYQGSPQLIAIKQLILEKIQGRSEALPQPQH